MKKTSFVTQSKKIYSTFLYLYPDSYRKRFGQEMKQVFSEMLSETYKKTGVFGVVVLWGRVLGDICVSLFSQHAQLEKQQTRFDIVLFSFFLILPSFLFLSIVFLKGIGISYFSNNFVTWLEHNAFYFSFFKASTPLVFIIAPFVALFLNTIRVVRLGIKRDHDMLISTFSLQLSLFHIILIIVSGLILAIVIGHVVVDSLPCLWGYKKIC
jgi:hypothetical protein